MKTKIVTILAFAILTSLVSLAQVNGFVELEGNPVTSKEATTTPQINFFVTGHFTTKWGWSAWSANSHPWSEAYVGPTFTPAKWISFSTAFGLETYNHPLRTGNSVWIGSKRWNLLSIQEYGGSGYWHKDTGTYALNSRFSIGAFSQRHVGTGPYTEMKLAHGLTAWGGVASTEKKGLAGIRYRF